MVIRHLNIIQQVCKRMLQGGLIIVLLSGCASGPLQKPIAPGDTVQLDYTCRLEDGAILATTHREIAYDEHAHLSYAFIYLKSYQPAVVKTDPGIQPWPKPMLHPLMDEIAFQLSKQLAGLGYDESHRVTITTGEIPNLPDMERFIQYAKTMRRPKKRSVPKAQFIANTGKEPELGEMLFTDAPVQWKVTGIQSDRVALEYLAEDGLKINMPYGEAVLRDRGDHFDLEIDARVGNLVRVGPYIGRISELDDRVFKADFAHPFGGRTLACEVTTRRHSDPNENGPQKGTAPQ